MPSSKTVAAAAAILASVMISSTASAGINCRCVQPSQPFNFNGVSAPGAQIGVNGYTADDGALLSVSCTLPSRTHAGSNQGVAETSCSMTKDGKSYTATGGTTHYTGPMSGVYVCMALGKMVQEAGYLGFCSEAY